MTAYATESGLTLICPRTGLAYVPSWTRIDVIDGARYIHSRCRWCDAKGHIRQDQEFDPSNPQIHTHIVKEQPND